MTADNRPARPRGYATMEYLCACAALAAALFVPIQDDASPDKARTAVEIVLDAVAHAYQNFSYAISLPS
jgi:hypothetical protein